MAITGKRAVCQSCGNDWNLRKALDSYQDGPRCAACGSRDVDVGPPDEELTDEERALMPPGELARREIAPFFEEMANRTGLDLDVIRFLILDEIEEAADLPTAGQLEHVILEAPTGVGSEPVAGAIATKYDRFLGKNGRLSRMISLNQLTVGAIPWGGTQMRVHEEPPEE